MPLAFGIYPGGAAGTVGPSRRRCRPEVASLRRNALQELRVVGRPFVVRLYDSYARAGDGDAVPESLAAQLAQYAADGFELEVALTYRPADPTGDLAGFIEFVRRRVHQLRRIANVRYLQVTNEANVRGAPDAADGAYPGATDALIRGVIAAGDEARRAGHAQMRIGFNWAFQLGCAESRFFSYLRATGGTAFADAIDWVGIDAYPGTWGPELTGGELANAVSSATIAAMRTLRNTLLPLAGLSTAAVHFSESGYPTGADRSEAQQQTVMRAAVETIQRVRDLYGVTDYRWFSLRDADSASPSFEDHYGITHDDYTPKPAYFVYRDLIADLG
jgi:hypothetical protein